MNKFFIFLLFIFWGGFFSFQSQVISSSKWSDLFSYNNVLAMKEDNGKIISATENGIFFYTPSTGEITKLSKANGLHEVKISAFDYNPSTKVGLVGYTSGNLDVISPNGIIYVVDIPLATGYTGSKKINHVSITGNQAVISVGYGVSIYNLDKKEFGDSAYFQTNGIYEASNEAVIVDGNILSATNSGLKSHAIENVTFPVYSTWSTLLSGGFTQIDSDGSNVAVSNSNTVQFGNSASFTTLTSSFTSIKDIILTSSNIIITDQSQVSVFSPGGASQKIFDAGESINTAIMVNGSIYAGSLFSGIYNESKKSFKPDGPYTNTSYKISIINDKLWVSTGIREGRYNFAVIDPRNLGFYYFTGTEWIYPSYFKNNPTPFNVLDAIANPNDNSEVYFTNYSTSTGQGIYKMKYNSSSKDFDFVKYYSTNTSIWFSRPVGLLFDDKGDLFSTLSFFDDAGAINTGIASYNKTLDSFSQKGFKVASQATQKPILHEGMLWIPSPRQNNFIVFDYNKTSLNFSDDKVYAIYQSNGLPDGSVGTISVAIDKSGDAWIGTDNGLRILNNASTAIKETNPKVTPIVITQNGIGEELLRDSNILQIDVDSGNHKWVSVDGGGVFLLSPDGQKTLLHFTKSNSPLPTNSATDVKVDNKTGKVYFVTLDGIVAYQGDAVDVNQNFGNVLVYPNPVVYAHYKGKVTIRGLAQKTNIRITDAAGNLVHQAVAYGGYYDWDLNNQRGVRVASGIYFVLMTNEDATDKATAKIAVVN